MLLAMRRENEDHHHTTLPTATTSPFAISSQAVAVTNTSSHNHNLLLSTSNASCLDSLNTPSTPLLNLGRSPLHFTAPPPPVNAQPVPHFGFYTTTSPAASSYFHHYTHTSPAYGTSSNNAAVRAVSNSNLTNSSDVCRSIVPTGEELEEFVDIFQVQHLLLDHSAANGSQPPPLSFIPTTTSASSSASTSVASTVTQAVTAISSSSSYVASLAKPQPRPRLNIHKASEYSAQLPADSPSSRRMLLDYPSTYLYGNHYHTSPNDDLVALWFGNNGSGMFIFFIIFVQASNPNMFL